jgi:hypothetical protein
LKTGDISPGLFRNALGAAQRNLLPNRNEGFELAGFENLPSSYSSRDLPYTRGIGQGYIFTLHHRNPRRAAHLINKKQGKIETYS